MKQSIRRQRCARIEDVLKLLNQTLQGIPFLSTTARATLPAPNSMKNTKTASISAPPDSSHTAASDADKTGDVASSAALLGRGMRLQEKNHDLQNYSTRLELHGCKPLNLCSSPHGAVATGQKQVTSVPTKLQTP